MVESAVLLPLVVVALGLVLAALSLRVVQQFEEGVVFRLGRVQDPPRGPGLTVLVPVVDRMLKVNRQVMTLSVPAQDCITRDNVSVRVDAVVYFRVVDAVKAAVNVQNYQFAISQLAQTSLRSVIGKAELDDLLSNREKLGTELTEIIDAPSEVPWGVKVERVEVKDVTLPETMKRSMSRQAEAERERRSRVIVAEGELQASETLTKAAEVMAQNPAALQLRLLQTVVEVAAEKNSTLVLPFPVELLRFLEGATPARATPPSPPPAPHRPPPPPAVPPVPDHENRNGIAPVAADRDPVGPDESPVEGASRRDAG
jgi:regulator of protease activity HflC (stomatin/prohibitin superfamily)